MADKSCTDSVNADKNYARESGTIPLSIFSLRLGDWQILEKCGNVFRSGMGKII